jgi:LPXTG-site transpeptidase (sortase) family protein
MKSKFKSFINIINQNKLLVYSAVFFSFCVIFYSSSILFTLTKGPNSIPEEKVSTTVAEIEKNLKLDLQNNKKDDTNVDDGFKKSNVNLFIPKIGLNLGILNGSEKVLEEGIWDKYPERFLQEKSNIVLSGHRFSIGLNPLGVERASPLLHADKLEKGDSIYLISATKTVNYKIVNKFKVSKNGLWIMDNSADKTMLTLYTCGEEGADGDRMVFRGEAV